jgi:hypothetical protein
VEQGETRWPESTVQAKGNLDDPRPIANSKPMSRAGAIQLGAYRGRSCVVNEPFGEIAVIGLDPVEKDPPMDMTPIRDAFSRFRFRLTFDGEFKR